MEKKIIDWETAIERLGGDKEFLVELLNELVDQIEQSLPELKTAIEQNAFEEVRSVAHGLKGAAANLGADKISAKFYELEVMGKEEKLDGALGVYNEIVQMYEELKQELA
ncbi:Hpt domain-containing protein [Calditrichota bacterium GD2]